eukprot:gene838-2554_t
MCACLTAPGASQILCGGVRDCTLVTEEEYVSPQFPALCNRRGPSATCAPAAAAVSRGHGSYHACRECKAKKCTWAAEDDEKPPDPGPDALSALPRRTAASPTLSLCPTACTVQMPGEAPDCYGAECPFLTRELCLETPDCLWDPTPTPYEYIDVPILINNSVHPMVVTEDTNEVIYLRPFIVQDSPLRTNPQTPELTTWPVEGEPSEEEKRLFTDTGRCGLKPAPCWPKFDAYSNLNPDIPIYFALRANASNPAGIRIPVTVRNWLSPGEDLEYELLLKIMPVNDRPGFLLPLCNEDKPLLVNWTSTVLVERFATEIMAGPTPDEDSSQTVTFVVVPNDPSLFRPNALPKIDATTGSLIFTPKAGWQPGEQIVLDIVLVDDGGIENGGHDTSWKQTCILDNGAPELAEPDPQCFFTTCRLFMWGFIVSILLCIIIIILASFAIWYKKLNHWADANPSDKLQLSNEPEAPVGFCLTPLDAEDEIEYSIWEGIGKNLQKYLISNWDPEANEVNMNNTAVYQGQLVPRQVRPNIQKVTWEDEVAYKDELIQRM